MVYISALPVRPVGNIVKRLLTICSLKYSKYYSIDMRAAALSCISRGKRREDIIKFFGSLITLSNWVRLERESRDHSPNIRSGYKSCNSFKQYLLQKVKDNPDYTLDECSQSLSKHQTRIFYPLKILGIARKNNHAISGVERRKKATFSGGD